jgi:hypothetical protein
MFRKFSLFDSSPPPTKLSINPPRASNKAQRKSAFKSAIFSSLQLQNSPEFSPSPITIKPNAKRSKSLDHSNNKDGIQQAYQRAYHTQKSLTLPPVSPIRELPQSDPMSTRWYTRFGNSFRRGPWARRDSVVQYQVCIKITN